MIEYLLLGVLSPILLNLMHMAVGIYVVVARGNIMSLGFTVFKVTVVRSSKYTNDACMYGTT